MRWKILKTIRKLFPWTEGSVPPKWVLILKAILFPLDWWYMKQSRIRYDLTTDSIWIYGVRISQWEFEEMINASKKGTNIFISRKDETLIFTFNSLAPTE